MIIIRSTANTTVDVWAPRPPVCEVRRSLRSCTRRLAPAASSVSASSTRIYHSCRPLNRRLPVQKFTVEPLSCGTKVHGWTVTFRLDRRLPVEKFTVESLPLGAKVHCGIFVFRYKCSRLSPFLTGRMFVRPNILRTLRRSMIRFLIELLVRRIWFGQSKLYFVLNWLVMRCKLRPELAADAQQTASPKI